MAFPTTLLLDDFTRADSSSSAGSNWTMRQQLYGISSNALYNATGSGYSIGNWNVATYGPDCEVYATWSVLPASGNEMSLWLRMTDPVLATFTCYGVTHLGVTNALTVRKFISGSATTLTSATVTMSAGDKLGIQCIGTAITVYRYTAGSWTSVASTTDSSITAAGYLGNTIQNGTARMDDFSGGTYLTPAGRFTQMRVG